MINLKICYKIVYFIHNCERFHRCETNHLLTAADQYLKYKFPTKELFVKYVPW